MLTPYLTRAAALVAALLTTVACSDDGVSGPDTPELETVALVELQGTRPAFYIQKSDGSDRSRIHFTGAVDQVPGCVEEDEQAILDAYESGDDIEVVDDVDIDAFREQTDAWFRDNLDGDSLAVYESIRSSAP